MSSSSEAGSGPQRCGGPRPRQREPQQTHLSEVAAEPVRLREAAQLGADSGQRPTLREGHPGELQGPLTGVRVGDVDDWAGGVDLGDSKKKNPGTSKGAGAGN